MIYKFLGDGINTRTLLQKSEDGEFQLYFLLTPELLKYLEEIKQKIDSLEKIVSHLPSHD